MIEPKNYIVEEEWFKAELPRQEFRAFMQKNNYRGIIDTLIWFTCLGLTGYLAFLSLGTAWAIPAFFLYGVFYCAADARWHESSHGTVFKTPWLNTALCFIATSMQQRDIIFTNWSHVRHHSYTVINDIDPEITVTRPPTFWEHFLNFWSLGETKYYVPILFQHAFGIVSKDAKKFVPEEEYTKMFWWARASLLVNLLPIALAVYFQTWLPVLYFGLPKLYGNLIQRAFVLAQHAGLDDDTWDHRKNSRTIYVNPFLGFLYMNMQYHIEHHMNPLMPFHQLPKFSRRVADQMPVPYKGMIEVYKEMIPALIKQVDDPTYFVDRKVPTKPEVRKVKRIKALAPEEAMIPQAASSKKYNTNDSDVIVTDKPDVAWHKAVEAKELGENDAVSVCIEGSYYAVYQLKAGEYYATDGICSHEYAYLADGLVEDGKVLCPKHNSKFCIKTGKAINRPAKTPVATFPIKDIDGVLHIGI
ncbi:fatty acid desaturase [Colwellia sp. RE-S-Sl-9]